MTTVVNRITRAEADRLKGEAMTEAILSGQIAKAARQFGWLRYHTWQSKNSASGFPDEVAVHYTWERTVFAELKREPRRPKKIGGRYGDWVQRPILSAAQARWLDALAKAHREVYLFLPRDWIAGTIQRCFADARGAEDGGVQACRWGVRRYQLDELGVKVVRK